MLGLTVFAGLCCAHAQTYFFNSAQFSTGDNPVSVAAGDLNRDGKEDLAIAVTGGVSVLLGNPDGTFQNHVEYSLNSNPSYVVIADLNRDGHLDIIAVNTADFTMSVLPGQGDGSFPTVQTYLVGANPVAAAVADFNGDGCPDVVVANSYDATLSVLLSKIDGSLQTKGSYPVGPGVLSVAAADFNGDGKIDLVAASPSSVSVSVLIGVGDGTFAPYVAYATAPSPSGVATGDFNADGKMDVATHASILLGKGDGTFASHLDYDSGCQGEWLDAADFDGDGKLDIATACGFAAGAAHIMLGRGDGTFQAPVLYPAVTPAGSLTTADFNADGRPDLAVVSYLNWQIQPAVEVLLGPFNTAVFYPVGGYAAGIAVADLNNDGVLDLAGNVGNPAQSIGGISVLLGEAGGTFAPYDNYPAGIGMVRPSPLFIADMNHDDVPDAVLAGDSGCGTTGCVYVLIGNGDGTFQPAVIHAITGSIFAVTGGDFNGDLITDVALVASGVNGDSTVFSLGVMLGNGDGSLQSPQWTTLAGITVAIANGDLNGDGKLDLLVPTTSGSIFLGNGDGTFRPPIGDSMAAGFLTLFDLNGDLKLDIAAVGGCTLSISLGNGDGTFQPSTNYSMSNDPACDVVSIAVGDFSADGKPDLLLADMMLPVNYVWLGAGDGTFQSRELFPRQDWSFSAAAGDFNGDGVEDSAFGAADTIVVRLNYPSIAFFPANLSFPPQALGSSSTPLDITIYNPGVLPLPLASITSAGDFVETDGCGASIAPGANCSISVTFTPTATGYRTGSLTISDSAAGSPQVLALTGTGGIVPIASLSAGSLSFTSQLVGVTSPAQFITLTNTGNGTLNMLSLTTRGDFSQTHNCAAQLSPGTNCTISVTFTPTLAGEPTGQLVITDDASDSPQTVSLYGSSTDFSLGIASGSAPDATITAGQSATYNLVLVPAGGFSGVVSLSCSGAPFGSNCTISAPTLTVTDGIRAQFSVIVTTIRPIATGSVMGSSVLPRLARGLAILLALLATCVLVVIMLYPQPLRHSTLGCLIVFYIASALVGCGGSSANGGPESGGGTPSGTYTLTVTATQQGISRTLNLTLTVSN